MLQASGTDWLLFLFTDYSLEKKRSVPLVKVQGICMRKFTHDEARIINGTAVANWEEAVLFFLRVRPNFKC